MKTKVKRLSRRGMSAVLTVILVLTCLMVGNISTKAYGGGTLAYTVTKDDNSTEARTSNFTLSNNTGTISLNFTDAKVGSTVTCTLTIDNDVFGENLSLTQGNTGWMKRSGTYFTIKVTAKATVSFNILQMQPGGNPPSLRYSITDNAPDYYLVGSQWKDGSGNWTLPNDHTRDLVYTSSTGYYQITLSNLPAQSSGSDITYTFRVRNKGRTNWDLGSNYNFDNLVRPVTDSSGLVKSLASASSDKNIDFKLKSDANVTIAFNEATSKIYMTVTPTTCTVTTSVTPAVAGTATVTNGTDDGAGGKTFAPGDTVSLTAASSDATRYVFSKWTANSNLAYDDATSANPTAVVSGDALARAEFTKRKYDVTCTGDANGSVSVGDTTSYAWGDKVDITVTPDSGYTLDTLTVNSGAVTVDDNSFTMPVGNAAVAATFRALVNRTVTYGTDGNGYVSVGYQYSDTQDQITQSVANGSTDVLEGSKLNFCAIPKPGYEFDGWYTAASGGTELSTTQDETVTVSGNVTRYAHFTQLDYYPTANKIKVLISKSAVDAGNTLFHYWEDGQGGKDATIPTTSSYDSINGVTDSNSAFYLLTLDWTKSAKLNCAVHNDGWTNQTKDLTNPQLEKGKTFIIEWSGNNQTGSIKQYSLPTAVYPVNLNVTNPEKASDTHVVAYATEGANVTVTATPADDTKKISVLTANDTDIKSTKEFTATSDNPNAVQVTYIDKPYYTVTYTASEGGTVSAAAGGTKLASGDTVMEGTSVTFTATPAKNYIFSAWSGASTSTTTPVSVTANSDIDITGNFTEISYAVVNGDGDVAFDMKKLPNGTWISTTTVPKDYWFSIKRLSDNYYSHSGSTGSDAWQLNWESADSTVTGKVNGRWYNTAPSGKQLYKSDNSKNFYVVYDPNANCKNENSYNSSAHKGRLWLTTNDDGLYPAYVYLKDGTVRSGTACSSLTGVTTLVAEGTTAGLTAANDSDYETKTVNSATEYLVKKVLVTAAQLRAGVKLHIRTDVIDQDFDPADATKGNGKDYYVKGFDVDGGLTQAILEQEFNDDDERTEKASYDDYNKIHGVGNDGLAWNDFTLELNGYVNDKIEVTPIYFKRAAKSTDNVRLYVQDYVGAVKEKWRGALAAYPYIEGVYDPYGGYPGTLMVNEGGRYMIDVPANYVNGSGESTPTQGLTLNNYIWDDVHNKIYFSDVSNRSDAHYQTYDYNEFEIINMIFQRDGLDEDIIFTFKYKDVVAADNSNLGKAIYYRDYEGYVQDKEDANYQKYSDGTIDARDYRTIQPTLSKAELADSKYQFENLADMYGNRVDIMGNLVDIPGNDEKAAYNPIHIISNGYDYGEVGKYATAWAYYMPVDASDNPAWTGDFDHYKLFEVMGGQGNQGNVSESIKKFGSESYLIDPRWSDRIIAKYTNQVGTAKILDCENVPCVITYEYTIQQDISNLKDYLVNVKGTSAPADEDEDNMAYRSDGRWYFSNSDQLIKAHTAIAIVDSTGKIYTRDYYQDGNIDYTKGGYDPTEHTGLTTHIQAYFTNDGTETVEGREISNTAGNTECNSISDGAHTFDMTTVGDPDGDYEFVGWYYYNGTDYKLASESMTYSQEAKANDVFVAVYKRVSAGTLVVTHSLHEDSHASADCYATVQVKDGATVKYTSERTTDQIKIGPTYIKYNSSYNLVITLETEPENDFIRFENFYKSTISQLTAEGITGVTSSVTLNKAGSPPTATITVPIANLFDQEDGEKPQTTKALRFYSKVDYNTYTYEINYKYPAYNPSFGTQGYRTEGTFTNDELKGFMMIDSGDLTFKTNSDRADFINNKAPYEKNFMQTIGWNTSSVTQSYASNKLTINNVNAVTTDTEINISVKFPYDHNTEANRFAYIEDSANTGVKLDETDTVPVRLNKPKFNELLSFNEYKTFKAEGDPQLLAAPKMIVDKNGTPEDPSDDVTYYFRYWSVKAAAKGRSSEVEYTRCYNYVFDYVLFQNTVIEPVYTELGVGEAAESVTPISELNKDNKGVTISFIENSRNQYNGDQHSGAPYEDGVTPGTPSASRQKGADVVYSDFLLSFNNVAYDELGPIRLDKLEDGEMEAGLIIERVGAIGEGGVLSEEEYRALYGDTITNISTTGGSSGPPKDDLVTKLNSVIGGTTQTGYLKSAFDANEVDNKNRVDYYYGLLNRLVKDANHYEYDSYKSNRDNVYRAYAYIKKTATTPAGVKLKSESSDDASFVISQVPVYFTIYDIASIENGGMLS